MSALEPIQLERLREIGALLQRERESKGMSLEDVSAKTLIRPTILKAIEEANAKPLPEPVYLRGFIRRYGDLMDLPGVQLSDSFPWEPSRVVPAAFVASGVTTAESVDDTRRPTSLPRAEARVIEPDPVLPEPTPEPVSEPTPELATDPRAASAFEPEIPKIEAQTAFEPVAQVAQPKVEATVEATLESVTEPATSSPEPATLAAADLAKLETEPEFPTPSEEGLSQTAFPNDVLLSAPSKTSISGDEIPENLILPEPTKVAHEIQPDLSLGVPPAPKETSVTDISPAAQSSGREAPPDDPWQSEPSPMVEASPEPLPVSALSNPGSELAPPAPVDPLPIPQRPSLEEVTPEQQSGLPGGMIAIILAAIALGITIAFALSNRGREPVVDNPAPVESTTIETPAETLDAPSPPAENPQESIATEPSDSDTNLAENPGPEPDTGAGPTSNADEVSVQLKLKEPAWFYVEVDGFVVFEGIADEFTQEAKGKEIVVGTSRPDLLLVSVDGGASKPMGPEAADTVETYTPGG